MLRWGFVLLLLATSVSLQAKVLSLNEAIELALKNSATLKNDTLSTNSIYWAVVEAYSAMLPHVYLDYSYSRQKKTNYTDAQRAAAKAAGTTLDDNPNYWSTSISIQESIFSGLRLIDNVKIQHVKDKEQLLQTLIDKNDITIQVISSFITIAQAKTQIKDYELGYIPNLKHLVYVARERTRAGVGINIDYSQALLQLSTTELTLDEARDDLLTSKDALKRLLGKDYSEDIDIDEAEVLKLSTKDLNLNAILSNLDKTLTAAKARHTIRQAELNKEIAMGNHLPSLQAGYTYSWPSDHTIAPDGTPSWQFSLSLSIPIFTSLETHSAYKQSKIALDQAEITYNDNIYAMKQSIIAQYRNYERYKKRVSVYKSMINQAELVFNQRLEEYRIGTGTITAVIDAHKDLVDKKTTYINNLYSGLKAYFDLIKIISKEQIRL